MLQIRGDLKEKREGAKFRTLAIWDVPPIDRTLWGRDTARPRITLGRLDQMEKAIIKKNEKVSCLFVGVSGGE